MRKIAGLFSILLIIAVGSLSAQSLSDAKREVEALQGKAYVDKALELSANYLQQKGWQAAGEMADMAHREAQRQNLVEAVAHARYLQAKAIVDNPGFGKRDKKKARSLLLESLEIAEENKMRKLRLSCLIALKNLAQIRGKKNKVDKWNREIQELGVADRGKVRSIRKGQTNQLDSLNQTGFSTSPPSLSGMDLNEAEQEIQLRTQLNQLISENASLGDLLTEQEQQIDTLSRNQLQSQLKLAQQRIMLNSMKFQTRFDSFLMAQKELQLQEQKAQLKHHRSQRNFFIALAAIVILVGLGLLSRYISIKHYSQVLEEKNTIIQEEKRRSEDLLLNILPSAIAEELKKNGVAPTRQYETASIMFLDFQGFSKVIKAYTPEELIEELDYCFSAFDKIVGKYQLEKIKTIGDAYMCAGGVPDPDPDHPQRMILAAMEMQHFLIQRKVERDHQKALAFEARIGIHTGPIIAGVVGLKKFSYDVWGDTVNVAARVESKCEPGKINISGSTRLLLDNQFELDYRGKIPAKNVGEIEMYYVG